MERGRRRGWGRRRGRGQRQRRRRRQGRGRRRKRDGDGDGTSRGGEGRGWKRDRTGSVSHPPGPGQIPHCLSLAGVGGGGQRRSESREREREREEIPVAGGSLHIDRTTVAAQRAAIIATRTIIPLHMCSSAACVAFVDRPATFVTSGHAACDLRRPSLLHILVPTPGLRTPVPSLRRQRSRQRRVLPASHRLCLTPPGRPRWPTQKATDLAEQMAVAVRWDAARRGLGAHICRRRCRRPAVQFAVAVGWSRARASHRAVPPPAPRQSPWHDGI